MIYNPQYKHSEFICLPTSALETNEVSTVHVGKNRESNRPLLYVIKSVNSLANFSSLISHLWHVAKSSKILSKYLYCIVFSLGQSAKCRWLY